MQITGRMVLAAAQAIHKKFADRSGRAKDWVYLQPSLKAEYIAEAKAALEAASEAA